MNADGLITFVNQAAYRITGYTPEDYEKGFPAYQLIAPEEREWLKANIAGLLRGEAPTITEYTAQRRDGSRFPVLVRSAPIFRDGDCVGLRGIVIDISGLREAQEALRLEKSRFEALAESSPLGLVVISEGGRYLYSNPKFHELFGYGLDEISRGRAWFRKAFPDPKYRKQVISSWISDLKEAQPGEMRPRIYTVRCKDGTEKIVHFRPVQLESGEHLVTCEDITERKRAQLALEKSERRFRTLVEAAKDVIWTLDMNLRYTYASPSVIDLLGYTPREIMAMSPLDTLTPDSQERVRRLFDEELEQEKIQSRTPSASQLEDVAQFRKDGSVVWLEITTTSLRDENNRAVGVLGISHDITHRRNAEDSVRRSEETARALLNATADGAVLVDVEGTVLASNDVFDKKFAQTTDSLIGGNVFGVFPPTLEEHRRSRGLEVVRAGEPVRFVTDTGIGVEPQSAT